MEGKKLNSIWKELNDLRKDFAEAFRKQREEHNRQREADKASADRVVKAIRDKDITDVAPVVEATKTAAGQLSGELSRTTKAVEGLGEKTIKVEITNHQAQQEIDIPESVTLNDDQFGRLVKALQVTVQPPEVNVEVEGTTLELPEELRVNMSQEEADYVPMRLFDDMGEIPIRNLLKDIFTAAQSGIGVGATVSSGGGSGDSDISGGLDNLLLANGTDNLLLASGAEDVLLLQ